MYLPASSDMLSSWTIHSNLPDIYNLKKPLIVFKEVAAICLAELSVGKTAFNLNEALIKTRTAETEEVHTMLQSIFAAEQDKAPVQALESGGASDLSGQHRKLLLQLSEQSQWSIKDFQALCKQYNLMPDGAIETLNEWAYEKADAPLIEDGDLVYFDQKLAQQLING